MFHIERYGEVSKKISKEDQLKALQEKILRRKSSNATPIESNFQEQTEKPTNNATNKSLKKEKNGKSNGKVKKKKKRRKSESFTENLAQTDEDSPATPKIEKKKQKIIENDNNILNESSHLDESKSENNLNISENLSTGLNIINDKDIDEKAKTTESSFTILHKQKRSKKIEAKWTLPRWMANPVHISSNMNNKFSISNLDYLSDDLKNSLSQNNIETFFPVQNAVIPKLVEQNASIRKCYFHPSDICVQAPTGSGKTLSYVLPLVHILSKDLLHHLSCIVVLPSTDLAKQVKQVFDSIIQKGGFSLKVVLVTGLNTFAKEQKKLVQKSGLEEEDLCKVDIVVCTPGRLVDHIKQTEGFSLKYLRYLVIDEADKLLSQDYSGWLDLLLKEVYSEKPGGRNRLAPLNAAKFQTNQLPLQKLLFSATLTQNPGKLAPLSLFNPIFFITKINTTTELHNNMEEEDKNNTENGQKNNDGERFALPENLMQWMIVVKTTDIKPLVLLHLLHSKDYQKVVVFTKSVEATHRLYLLLQEYGGLKVSEFSSNLTEVQRKGIIRDFKEGVINIIISSDVMSRGMHVDHVELVVNYDAPANEKSYVHRIGRTARAGEKGEAITILASKEAYHFKKMCESLSSKCPRMKIDRSVYENYEKKYEEALAALKDKIIDEKHDKKNKYSKN